jgi:hypothetical protein
MAGGEDEAEEVVIHVGICGLFKMGLVEIEIAGADFAGERLVFVIDEFTAAEVIEGAAFADRHQPGAGIVRDAFGWPLFEGHEQGILREVFRQADTARDSCEARDQSRRFYSPDRVDCVIGIGWHL